MKVFQILFLEFLSLTATAQKFELFPSDLIQGPKPVVFRQILPTTKGTVLIANSLTQLAEIDKMNMQVTWGIGYPLDSKGNKVITAGRSDVFRDLFELGTGIKLIAEGPEKVIYFVTDNNHLGLIHYRHGRTAYSFPPFVFPENPHQIFEIRSIWLDTKGDLFIGTNNDSLYIVEDAANVIQSENKKSGLPNFTTGFDKDSNIIVLKAAKQIKKKYLGKGVVSLCFESDNYSDGLVFIGTTSGLYEYEKATGLLQHIITPPEGEQLTVTHFYYSKSSAFMWLSTLERGMGRYSPEFGRTIRWFPYKTAAKGKPLNPIETFCPKSANEFFVAPLDSAPAIFNTETGKYDFITDTSFRTTRNITTDIKLDGNGNLYVIKDGHFFEAKNIAADPSFAMVKLDSTVSQAVISDVLIGGTSYAEFSNYEVFNKISLKYYQNNLIIVCNARGFHTGDSLEFSWKLEGYNDEWSVIPYSMMDEKLNGAVLPILNPGRYTFIVRVRKFGEDWRKPEARLLIVIAHPFWQIWWFWAAVISGLSLFVGLLLWWRIKALKRKEREKFAHEKQILELEAKALRAQMNPHFIFNCLNSIKSLIQQHEEEKSVTYLTTFSKLIRTLFNNADKKEISLHDEIETCKLYLQLEAMRFDSSFSYTVKVDENLDLKSIRVPALIIQPFIENAIWHGIVPKGRMVI